MSDLGTCKTCVYRKTVANADRTLVQACKRFPPVPLLAMVQTAQGPMQQAVAIYPAVDLDDGCGEWTSSDTVIVMDGKTVGRFPQRAE